MTMSYVADTGRNRILELTHQGRLKRVFGAGTPGYWDGEGINAGFTDPHGIACLPRTPYRR